MAPVLGCHLVGSVPLPDAETVFRECLAALPGRLKRIPDGEFSWAQPILRHTMRHDDMSMASVLTNRRRDRLSQLLYNFPGGSLQRLPADAGQVQGQCTNSG